MTLCALTGAFFYCVLYEYFMTTSELRSFPPVDDVLDRVRNIDGEELRNNAKRDLHVIGKVLAFTGEQLHTFGTWLSEV